MFLVPGCSKALNDWWWRKKRYSFTPFAICSANWNLLFAVSQNRGGQKYEQNKDNRIKIVSWSNSPSNKHEQRTVREYIFFFHSSPVLPSRAHDRWRMFWKKKMMFFSAWTVLFASAGVRRHAHCVSWKWRKKKRRMHERVNGWLEGLFSFTLPWLRSSLSHTPKFLSFLVFLTKQTNKIMSRLIPYLWVVRFLF